MPSSVVLGTDRITGKPVVLDEEGRWYSAYVIGSTGTGKTTLLENIARQDMEKGDGLCFIDPSGDAAQRLLLHVPSWRMEDVIFWNAADFRRPLGLNPFECDPSNPLVLSIVSSERAS